MLRKPAYLSRALVNISIDLVLCYLRKPAYLSRAFVSISIDLVLC